MTDSNSQQTKLLAINFGGLGDEVLFLPTLKTIRTAYPNWTITLLTEPRARSIGEVTNLVDSILTFDIKKRPLGIADYIQLINLLRSGGFDIVISSGSSPQVSALLLLSGASKRIGYGSNKLARLLLTDPVPLNKQQHASLMYHDLVQGLGLDTPVQRPEVGVRAENVRSMKALLAQATTSGAGPRLVLIHPGTSKLALDKGVIKTWAPDRWAELVARITEDASAHVVLAGGPDDKETIAGILSALEKRLPPEARQRSVTSTFGKTQSLSDLVALMSICHTVVCVDSAPMHLAVGLNKPLVALFGPTDPAKLLWQSPQFIALRARQDVDRWGSTDPFSRKLPPVADRQNMAQTQYIQTSVEQVLAALQTLQSV